MKEYYVTFGQKDKLKKNGWVTINAGSLDLAREKAFLLFGNQFASVYEPEDLDELLYPLGELAVIF